MLNQSLLVGSGANASGGAPFVGYWSRTAGAPNFLFPTTANDQVRFYSGTTAIPGIVGADAGMSTTGFSWAAGPTLLASANAIQGWSLTATAMVVGAAGSHTISCPGAGATTERFGAGTSTGAAATAATACGNGATANQNNCSAFGAGSLATGNNDATALGQGATASANDTTAVGARALATAANGTAVGVGANARATSAVCIGVGADSGAAGVDSTAIGTSANCNGQVNSLAVGRSASLQGARSTALGANTAIGAHADSIALGRSATTTAANQFMVGSATAGQGITRFEFAEMSVRFDLTANTITLANGDTFGCQDFVHTGSLFETASTPAQITADQNDYALPANTPIARLSTDASWSITGFVALANRMIRLINVGTNDLTLKNLDGGSAAANQIITANGGDLVIAGDGSVTVWYDSTSTKWRVL